MRAVGLILPPVWTKAVVRFGARAPGSSQDRLTRSAKQDAAGRRGVHKVGATPAIRQRFAHPVRLDEVMTWTTFLPYRLSHRPARYSGRAHTVACGIINLNLALLLTLMATGAASAAPPGREAADFFEQHVRPLLIRRCYECHSEQLKKRRGGLALDSKEGWLKGGSRGPAIVPGNPEESLLIQAVRFEDEDLRMPPKGKLSHGKLSEGEILLLTQWVAMGALDPRTNNEARPPAWVRLTSASSAVASSGLSGRRLTRRSPPSATDRGRDSGLDRFVLAALEAKGLAAQSRPRTSGP